MNLEHVLRNIKTDGERRHLKSPEVAPEVCAPEGARVHTISLDRGRGPPAPMDFAAKVLIYKADSMSE
jgi:hypothetical protein